MFEDEKRENDRSAGACDDVMLREAGLAELV